MNFKKWLLLSEAGMAWIEPNGEVHHVDYAEPDASTHAAWVRKKLGIEEEAAYRLGWVRVKGVAFFAESLDYRSKRVVEKYILDNRDFFEGKRSILIEFGKLGRYRHIQFSWEDFENNNYHIPTEIN
jgi:hypothetical protein